MVKIIGGGQTFGVTVVAEERLADRRRREALARGDVPAAQLDAIGKDRRVELSLKPSAPLPLGTDYTLVFPAGMGSAEGPKVTEKPVEWAFSTYGPLNVQAVECQKWHQPCADGPLTLEFSNPVRAKDLKRALKVVPEVKLWWPEDMEATNESWVLGGDFKPATLYTVRVEGLVDTFAQGLGAPYTTQYATGDFPPFLDTVENRALIEKGQRVALPITHVNAPPVELAVTPLDGAEAVRWLTEPWRTVKGEVVDYQPLTLEGVRNKRQRSPLDLSAAMAKAPMALVRLRWQEGRYTQNTRTVVQVTDLAVHGKMSPNTVAVWVWSLADGTARANAQVELLDRDGQVVTTGRTAKDGTVTFPGVEALPFPKTSRSGGKLYGPPVVVARVRYDGDQTMVALDGDYRMAPYRFGLSGAWENTPPRAEGVAFTDRGIYRPGETLYVRGILRERSLGRLSTPAGRAVKVKLTDPRGETVGEVDATASAFGGVTAQFTLPPDGKLGDYGVEIRDADRELSWSTQARVAEYRAPTFLVDVTRAGGDLLAGEAITATVEGRYLFGAAMGGAETTWAVTRGPASYDPPEAKGFAFGKQVPWWAVESEPEAEEVARGAWTLDDEGRHEVQGGEAKAEPDGPSRYTVEAGVTDVDRQVGGGRTRFLVHPAAFYLGVRGPAGFATAGEAFDAELVARKASALGEPVAAPGVTLKLVRHEYNTVRKKNAAGAFETVSEKAEVVAASCTKDVAAGGPTRCSLTTDKAGYHQLVAEAKDDKGRPTRTTTSLWVVGPGYAAWLQDDDNKVEVVTDRAQYDVGQVAKLLVQSPYPEAEAWVTVEREGILMQKRVTLKGTATPIEIPINDAMIPNVFVGVVLARGRAEAPGKPGDPGRPSFRIGYAELKVVPDARRLAVEVKPDADRKLPGDELAVSVAVTDRRGEGVESEVTVWAVDEGVLALTGYEAPDVVAALNSPRGLSVRQGSNLSFLVPQLVYGDKGTPQGGGGGEEEEGDDPHVRKRFVTTPLFVGAAVTDKAGKVTVKGKLPDNLTT
ncbi:MAG: hypothetical protein KC613_08995, partial [Myxococcales bacterium]|nr:hypothetical protein [Myxococcales bacterium]